MRNKSRLRSFFSRPSVSAAIIAVYVAIISLSILGFGSTGPFALSLSCLATTLLLLASVGVKGIPDREAKRLFMASAILIISVAWVYFQTTSFFHLISAFEEVTQPTISISPADSLSTIQVFALPLLIYMAGAIIVRDSRDVSICNTLLLSAASAIIVVTSIEFFLYPNYVLFFPKLYYKDSLTVTFVNRNNAGTFIGLTCLLIARTLWARGRLYKTGDLWAVVFSQQRVSRAHLKIVALTCLFLIILLSLFLTRSRAAIICTLASLSFFIFLLTWLEMRSKLSGRSLARRLAATVATILLSMAAGLALFGEHLFSRIGAAGLESSRFCALPAILRVLTENIWLGTGAGTFEIAFASARDPACGVMGVWQKAHNTYLQIWIEFGILGPILAIATIVSVVSMLYCSLRSRSKSRSYGVLGLSGLLLVVMHSTVDFPLEIPAIASFFAAIIVLTTIVPGSGDRPAITKYGEFA
ncbi:O-antigen ligase family protein [Rhizobium sp. Rhizsp82]|uniref:O-antigen ligase family protein n=1 Tax=Rhizobium sp. Rhizsp82 TaxID=3243057 RepID=UPI0039B4DFAD